jgi:hypothetical protein
MPPKKKPPKKMPPKKVPLKKRPRFDETCNPGQPFEGTKPLEHVRDMRFKNKRKKLPPQQGEMGKVKKAVRSVAIILSHKEMTHVSGDRPVMQ